MKVAFVTRKCHLQVLVGLSRPEITINNIVNSV